MSERVKVEPDVKRIVEGLRDTGYEFNTAVADVIDNSIAAGAEHVEVRMALDFMGNAVVSVGDDGCGMDRDGLINAMRYGSKRRADAGSLGKFGLGLKTASTAFCRRLVLVSRAKGDAPPIRAAWDLDLMGEAGWELLLDEPDAHESEILDAVAPSGAGTVVFWDKVDRLLVDYKRPDGKAIKNAMKRFEQSLKDHIAMVYQRFLDPSDERARTLEILVNGEKIDAWDPFCLIETKAPDIEKAVEVVLASGAKANFTVRAFILPRPEEFTTKDNMLAARISNDLQGVYVYRENRLIHGPDWLGMFKFEPHLSLIRVELSFTHEMDDAFQVDIKKSRILLSRELFDWLRDKFLTAPRREANNRSRKGAVAKASGSAALLHKASNSAIGMRVDSLVTPEVSSSDETTGAVEMKNNSGYQSAVLHIVIPDAPSTVHVATQPTLDNGVLWEPSLIKQQVGVSLNAAHPYYLKAYLPNTSNSPLIQALDFLLWSLAQAELNNVSNDSREAFEEFRIEVSRNLKKLVADLPDPVEELLDSVGN